MRASASGISRVGELIEKLRTEVNIRRQILDKTERTLGALAAMIQQGPLIVKELVVGDKYEAGQVAVQGPNGTAHHIQFSQIWLQHKEKFDLNQLSEELKRLQTELRSVAAESEHFIEMGAIATAEVEARKGNGEKVIEALSKAGKWSLGVAEKIGVGVATAALKTSLGV